MVADFAHTGTLRFSLALEGRPCDRVRVVELGGLEVELRAAPEAHQAIVRGGGGELCETVGDLPGGEVLVPAWLERHHGAGRYVFRSCVERLPRTALTRRAEALREQAREDPAALVDQDGEGVLTALSCRELRGGVAWSTWRLYPQAGELLITRSRLLAA